MQNGSMNVQTEGGEMIHIMNTLQETEDDTLTMGSLRCAYWKDKTSWSKQLNMLKL